MSKICYVEDCENEALAKGLCRKHYLRLYRNGTLTTSNRPKDVDVYNWLISKCVESEGGCKLYTGALTAKGYVHIKTNNGLMRFGHVIVYERHFSKIPNNKEISHTCHKRNCLNIDHLKAVTHVENIRASVDYLGSEWGFGKLPADSRKAQAIKAAKIKWNNELAERLTQKRELI